VAPVRVVLADDHPIWRDGVRADLADGFTVVGEASTADEAIAAIRAHHPDLVVCDCRCRAGVASRS
jgi:DNA-binding NarL/FixJ family response regulator